MQQNVTVGVTAQTLVMRNFQSANLERNTAFEFMRVPAIANSHAEALVTDLHGFSRIFFLSLLQVSLLNWGFDPKLSSTPISISVDLR